MSAFDIREAFARSIERTEHPLAPIILAETYNRLTSLGQMLAKEADREQVAAYVNDLLRPFSEARLKRMGGDAAFIMALASILSTALKDYAINTTQGKWPMRKS